MGKGAGLADVAVLATSERCFEALQYERRAELNFEGHRFFDLVRLGQAQEVIEVEEFCWIMPIPPDELEVSGNLRQNLGCQIR